MLVDPIEPLKTAAATFAAAKIAYTTRLTKLAADFNAGKPVTAADLNDLIIAFYNPMTVASNELRSKVADLSKAAPNDTAVFDAIFGTMINLLCGLQTKDQANDVIAKLTDNLTYEVGTWFDFQTPTIAESSFSAEVAFAGYKGETPVDHSAIAAN